MIRLYILIINSTQESHTSYNAKNPYRFDVCTEIEERTFENLKQRCDEARKGLPKVESIIATLAEDLNAIQKDVLNLIQQAQKSLKRLQEMALKPDPLTEMEFIDQLIESENQEKRPGYLKRINTLNSIRKQAILLRNLEHLKEQPANLCDKHWWEAPLHST